MEKKDVEKALVLFFVDGNDRYYSLVSWPGARSERWSYYHSVYCLNEFFVFERF